MRPSLKSLGRIVEQRSLRMLLALMASRFAPRCAVSGELPPIRPLIFASNHPSDYDAWFALPAIRKMAGDWPATLAWPGLRRLPVLRCLENEAACPAVIAEDRGHASLWTLIATLKRGRSIFITPEGSTSAKLARLHDGAAIAALRTGAWIVPCSVKIAPRRRLLPQVSFHFHAAIDPSVAGHLPLREGVKWLLGEIRTRLASEPRQ